MILSSDKKLKLTSRDKAIEMIREALEKVEVSQLENIIGGNHQEILFRMSPGDRTAIDYHLENLKKSIIEKCLKERGKKVPAPKL